MDVQRPPVHVFFSEHVIDRAKKPSMQLVSWGLDLKPLETLELATFEALGGYTFSLVLNWIKLYASDFN